MHFGQLGWSTLLSLPLESVETCGMQEGFGSYRGTPGGPQLQKQSSHQPWLPKSW
jgi:hypothetical protein